MRSIDYSPDGLRRFPSPGSRLEELSGIFQLRLYSERQRLSELAGKLAGGTDRQPTYQDLRLLAHRLAGAAMIFEEADIGRAAEALESAAIAALGLAASDADPGIRDAVDAVLKLLPQSAQPPTVCSAG